MAPEQARGEPVDQRADVFGLGALLCVILTGRPPYTAAEPHALLAQAAQADLADAFDRLDESGADEELLALAWACLDPEPDRRPHDAGEVARELTAYRAAVRQRLRDAELAKAAAEARAVGERRARRLTATLAAAGLAVLSLLLLLGAGWAWREREQQQQRHERAERAARVAGEVEADLSRADDLRRRAEAADPDDPREALAAWAGALAAAKQAAGRVAADADAGEALRGRVDDAVAALEQGQRDRAMRARLEGVRLAQTEVKDDGAFDPDEAPRAYAAAFRDYGIDVPALPPDEAAGRVRRAGIADELGVALDDWAQLTRDEGGRARLVDVAGRLDPVPGSWRNRLRDAVARRDRAALEGLARSAEADALPPATTYLLGKALEEAGAYAEAVALLRRAQRRHPGDFWVNHRLAFQLTRLRPPRLDEAVRYFTAAQALRPRSPGAQYSLGDALLERGAVDEAIPPLREAVRLKPGLALAHFDLGNALSRKGNFAEASVCYREAIRLKPGYPEAHNNLGNNLMELNRLDDAEAAYREALRLRPGHANAAMNIGFAYYGRRRFDDALATARGLVARRPDDFHGHYLLGITLRQKGDDDASLAALQETVRRGPKFPYARQALGEMLRERGRPGEALAEFRADLRLLPTHAEAYREAGRAHERMGQTEEAVAAYREAVRLKPALADAHLALGDALLARGDVSAARAAWADALRVAGERVASGPAAAADLWALPRQVAARAAVRLGTGPGAASASAGEAARLRRQALDWLRADLARWELLVASGDPFERHGAAKRLAEWRDDPALAGVRDAGALEELPRGERDGWRRLWADADAARKRAAGE
jgi:serine/threonine-protein kinase